MANRLILLLQFPLNLLLAFAERCQEMPGILVEVSRERINRLKQPVQINVQRVLRHQLAHRVLAVVQVIQRLRQLRKTLLRLVQRLRQFHLLQ